MKGGREVMGNAAEDSFKDALQTIEAAATPEEKETALKGAAAAAEEIEDEEKKANALAQVEKLKEGM